MTFLFAVLAFAAPLAASFLARREESFVRARRAGIAGTSMGIAASLAFAAGRFDPADPGRWMGIAPVFVSLVGAASVAMSPARESKRGTIANILLVSAASVALVLVRHPVFLAVLWAASMIPVWLELSSQDKTRDAARVFAVYMAPSAVLVGVGAALWTRGMVTLGFIVIAAGLAARAGMIPMHSWFALFFERAPMGLAVAFLSPQLGVYAHLVVFSGGLPPELGSAAAALGAVTAVYAAAMGVAQSRTRRALAYLVLSQSGLVAFGLDFRTDVAKVGTLVAWMVTGLATAGFAMSIGALEARRGQLSLSRPKGNFNRVPRLATAFLVTGLASVGLPPTLGFVAEDLLVQGSIGPFPILAFALIAATALNGVTVMRNFFLLFSGTSRHIGERDLTARETAVLTALVAALVAGGIWPSAAIRLLDNGASRGAAHDAAAHGPSLQ